MYNVIDTNKKSVFFIGDIHGQFQAIPRWIKLNNLKNCIVIFCGDFGFGFNTVSYEENELHKSETLCEELNIDCYIVRGNHDDPSYFTSEQLSISHFKPVPDYTVIQTTEHNILCVGGAFSVDRLYRKSVYEERLYKMMISQECELSEAIKNTLKVWWEDEKFVYDGIELENIKNSGIKIDVVATHSAPDFCEPTHKLFPKQFSDIDKSISEDCMNERIDITRLYNYLTENDNTITHWFYGHFHKHYFNIINNTRFYGLDMGRASNNSNYPGWIFDMVEIR